MRDIPTIKSAQEAIDYVRQRDLPYVRVGLFDIDGVFRGKYIGRDKFESSIDKGLGFCDVVVGWDSNDQLYDNVKVTGWHSGYPDAAVRMLPETLRIQREHLARHGVQTLVHYPVPPHRQPAYASLRDLRLPVTDRIHAEVLSLPVAAVLRGEQVERVIEACMSYADDP